MGRMERTPLVDTGCVAELLRPVAKAEPQVFDSARVDLEDWSSRQFWSASLNLTDAQLERMVKLVGTSVTDLENHLEQRRQRRAQRRRSVART